MAGIGARGHAVTDTALPYSDVLAQLPIRERRPMSIPDDAKTRSLEGTDNNRRVS